MPHDWILDVLSDLNRFARMNGMPNLARQLQDAAQVAVLEMTNLPPAPPVAEGIPILRPPRRGDA